MIPQTAFMISAPIGAGKQEDLRQLIASINSAPGLADPYNTLVPFYQFDGLHFARFVIIETNPIVNDHDLLRTYGIEPSHWPATLAFMGDIDGRLDVFLAELVVRAGAGLQQIFSHCAGFDTKKTNMLQWMTQHHTKPQASYCNWRGRTVKQIKQEYLLYSALRDQLEKSNGLSLSPDHIYKKLKAFMNDEVNAGRLTLSPQEPILPVWAIRNFLHLIGLPLILLVLFPVLLVAAPFFFIYLRSLEKTDIENTLPPPHEHLHRLAIQEDLDVTNHFNVLAHIKPGLFRRATFTLILVLTNYASKHIYHRGYLARIQTIHFAHWVVLDNYRRIYFATNYDGSAESYMDDFINKVAWGLNLLFSNCVGYPRTRWLIKGGAENEERYKRSIRIGQFPTESWYRASPGLTAIDLARHSRVRQGLEAKCLSRTEIKAWLSLL
ncbi:MAG: hypothetical protein ACJAUP_002992 [Cellvibrionaceae bacterium]|jgi:hypothetical protein